MKAIDIDFDVHRLIEAERKGFDEPENDALRRLLKLPVASQPQPQQNAQLNGKPFVEKGVSVPHGSEARMFYMRGSQHYEGAFLDGYLVVNGRKYSALSAAASELAKTKDGKSTSLNGWIYWEVKFPNSNRWIVMDNLRK